MTPPKPPARPLAPHVQRCLGGPVAHVQAMMAPGRPLAPHVQAAVQRQVPVLQARMQGPVLPGKPAVIQRSISSVASFEIAIEKGDENRNPTGTQVKMSDTSGKWAYGVAGIYTKEVRNCVVFCMFSSHSPLKKIYMLHTPVYSDILEAGATIAKEWQGVDFKSYIIGGNDEKAFEEVLSLGAWAALNIVGVKSPLTLRGSFADIEAKDHKITYWIKGDEESTAVDLMTKI